MGEKRSVQRQRVLKAGSIEFGGSAIDCTVRNLSPYGAALEVTSPLGIPEQFDLVVKADDSRRPARIVWRREKRIGIRFG